MLFMEMVFLQFQICPGEAAPLGKSTWREIIQSWERVLNPDLILTLCFLRQVMGSVSPHRDLDLALSLSQHDLQRSASMTHKAAQPSMRRAVLSQAAQPCAASTSSPPKSEHSSGNPTWRGSSQQFSKVKKKTKKLEATFAIVSPGLYSAVTMSLGGSFVSPLINAFAAAVLAPPPFPRSTGHTQCLCQLPPTTAPPGHPAQTVAAGRREQQQLRKCSMRTWERAPTSRSPICGIKWVIWIYWPFYSLCSH